MAPPPLDLNDVQGDILVGLPKRLEACWFIQIKKANEFRTQLSQLIPSITSSVQAKEDEKACFDHRGKDGDITLAGINMAFSRKGLDQLGFKEPLSENPEDPFEKTMLATAESKFNDQVHGFHSTWFKEFKEKIHCLIFTTGDFQETIDGMLAQVKNILGTTVEEVKLVQGNVRPGKQAHHEHFGYNDGISQPAIKDIDSPLPGQQIVQQGVVLLGRPGDNSADKPASRPEWTLDGSFLAFRYLSQLVPEFQDFVNANNPQGAAEDLFGAQLVGRWKSGTPLVLAPKADTDPALGKDPQRNNKFDYNPSSQKLCPYAAHSRKTNPRSDIRTDVSKNRIVRRAIAFGPELTAGEIKSRKTVDDRGLLFKCYQSNIANGFEFIQQSWANSATFPFLKLGTNGVPVPKPGFTDKHGPGIDAIIGQAKGGGVREMNISDIDDESKKVGLPKDWVISRGGEYYFAPSISQLKKKFALEAKSEL